MKNAARSLAAILILAMLLCAGIAGAEKVLAVNKDPEAPIFSVADVGIVGDLNDVVPALITAFRKRTNPAKP